MQPRLLACFGSAFRHKLGHAGPHTCRRYASHIAAKPEIYDVVCVGGGPAGLSLVNGLRATQATADLKIALIESQELDRGRLKDASINSYSNRCSSLTPASVGFLKDIGAWDHVNRSRVQPYQEMQVWDGLTDSRISFDWSTHGSSSHSESTQTIAYMTENQNLTTGLLDRLNSLGGVSIYSATRVESISFGPSTSDLDLSAWPVVNLSKNISLAARLLIGADGANSPVRTFAGIQSRGWDYNRHGVVATVHLEGHGWGDETHKIAYQRFLPSGPAALLPLPGKLSTLVWSTTPERAALLKKLRNEDFLAMVNAAFRLSAVDLEYLHTIPSGQADEVAWREQHTSFEAAKIPQRVVDMQEGSVASFPLRMRHADTYTGERVALVGDAAHSMHPLAGQGLNSGQADVAALLRTIENAVRHGQDIGAQMSLESYGAERYAANNAMLGVVDKLHKLYSVGSGPLVSLRGWGLNAVNMMGPVKEFFMRTAAGG